MKLKKLRHLICILLTVALLTSGLSVFAEDIAPYYTGTSAISASLSISSSGKASCSGIIRLYSGYSASFTMKLQKYTGGYWSTVKTWSTSDKHILSKEYYVTSGYNYRVVTSASVYNSSGAYVETTSAISQTVSY